MNESEVYWIGTHLFANWILPSNLKSIKVPLFQDIHHRVNKYLSVTNRCRHSHPLIVFRVFQAASSKDNFNTSFSQFCQFAIEVIFDVQFWNTRNQFVRCSVEVSPGVDNVSAKTWVYLFWTETAVYLPGREMGLCYLFN